jgi:hypothetical protein
MARKKHTPEQIDGHFYGPNGLQTLFRIRNKMENIESRPQISWYKLNAARICSAEEWEELLLPEIERRQKLGKQVMSRADAAFAKPEIYEVLKGRG